MAKIRKKDCVGPLREKQVVNVDESVEILCVFSGSRVLCVSFVDDVSFSPDTAVSLVIVPNRPASLRFHDQSEKKRVLRLQQQQFASGRNKHVVSTCRSFRFRGVFG